MASVAAWPQAGLAQRGLGLLAACTGPSPSGSRRAQLGEFWGFILIDTPSQLPLSTRWGLSGVTGGLLEGAAEFGRGTHEVRAAVWGDWEAVTG